MSSREVSSRNSSDEDDDDDDGKSKGERTDGDKTENEDDDEDEDFDKTENEEEDDDDDDEKADKTDNEEGEENNGNDGENNEKGGKKHVSFKEGPIDQIKAVHQEINSISSNIDMFLQDLAPSSAYKSRYPPTNQSYLSQSAFSAQQYQPNQTFQNHNHNNNSYSLNAYRLANPPGSVQQFSVGTGSTAQSRQGNTNNKFFYSKSDMSSANKPNTQGFMPTSQVAASNYQSQLFAANLRAAGLTSSPKEQETNEQNNLNERRESKFNYYGQYRFRADREGLNNSNNPSFARQSSFTAQAAQQPVRDKFEKRVDKINSEIDVLAQSINIDQSEQPIFKGGINPALYRRVNQLQAIQQGGGVNERPFLMERRNSSSRSSRTSETQFRPQNPKDLYRYRPKRSNHVIQQYCCQLSYFSHRRIGALW